MSRHLRIAKAIARATGLSRRNVEKDIAAGSVRLNGEVVADPAIRVALPSTGRHAGDAAVCEDLWIGDRKVDLSRVELDSGAPRGRTKLWALHKLPRELVTDYDPDGRPTIAGRLRQMMGADFYGNLGVKAVGRLDYMSEGLLLLTNDGILKRYLELPRSGMQRIYSVTARGKISARWLAYLRRGAEVNGKFLKPMSVEVLESRGRHHSLEITLTEGKNREIRRALAAGGLSVKRLIRTSYGPYHLGNLSRGSLLEIKPRKQHLKRMVGF